MKKIRNIIFDLGGVLVGLDGQRSVEAFNRLGCEAVSRYIEEHRTEDLFHRIELGLTTTQDFCEEVRQMTGTKALDDEIVAAWNALLMSVTAERLSRLRALKQAGYRIFLLSNTNDMHWQHCGGDFAGCFERVFLSYELGLAKPDVAIFAEVLRQAELQAEETLFIDDNEANVSAAKSLGINIFHNKNINDWLEELSV